MVEPETVGPSNYPRNSGSKCSISCRYLLALLSSLGFCVVYALRVNLSVALVSMVNSTYANSNADSANPECPGNSNSTGSSGKVRCYVICNEDT